MQLELVLDGLEEMKHPVVREVLVDGVQMLIEETGPGSGRVHRVLSTNPAHYLRPDFKPGASLQLYKEDLVQVGF
jgi:hypothetical protein